jgi:hypothetical protein
MRFTAQKLADHLTITFRRCYKGSMYRWRIYLIGKSPARYLGIVSAPDRATALMRAGESFRITEEQNFRLLAQQVVDADDQPKAERTSKR